jgi:hypothetical protein
VDSTNNTEPSGEMPVSRLMIQHIEPLLQVRCLFFLPIIVDSLLIHSYFSPEI